MNGTLMLVAWREIDLGADRNGLGRNKLSERHKADTCTSGRNFTAVKYRDYIFGCIGASVH